MLLRGGSWLIGCRTRTDGVHTLGTMPSLAPNPRGKLRLHAVVSGNSRQWWQRAVVRGSGRQPSAAATGSGSNLQRQPPHVGTSDNGNMLLSLRAVVPPGHQGAGRELAGWHCVIRDSLDRVGFKPYAFATLRLPCLTQSAPNSCGPHFACMIDCHPLCPPSYLSPPMLHVILSPLLFHYGLAEPIRPLSRSSMGLLCGVTVTHNMGINSCSMV